jgi:thiosulfate/3-mercaptopyruvate sulfurtransferase
VRQGRGEAAESTQSGDAADPASATVPPIVDAAWLRTRQVADPRVVVCHVGSTMAGPDPLHDFDHRHLPGARFVSLDDVLAAPPSGTAGRHPLPSPAEFAQALGDLGIADDAIVVAYDDRGGAFAGRLVWMLRILGQPAALLDGGMGAWVTDIDGAVEHDTTEPSPVERTVHDWPLDALADAIDVAKHIARDGVVIDSRDPARYAGEIEPIDPVAGHVPGAFNLLFTDNLDADGRFRPIADLSERFAPFTNTDDLPIVYCGSGVTACHNALAMEHAGLGLPRVYVGSWSGWIADPDRPVATGGAPWGPER